MLQHYLAIVIYFTISLFVALGIIGVSRLLGPKKSNARKILPYECGIVPDQDVAPRFSVKFYLIAMLFMVFDVETVSFFPWAVLMKRLGAFGLWEMLMFIIVLAIGYAYVWKRGGFQWQS